MLSEPSSTAHPPIGKMHALTSVRFFAAFLVVLFHTSFLIRPALQSYAHSTLLRLGSRVISLGYTSVSFFFLLSGYILATVYLRTGRPLSIALFYRARIARVYPLFLATLVLDTPYLLAQRWQNYGPAQAGLKTMVSFMGTALMLHAWIPVLGGIDFPNWSLGVEAFLYVVFPFAAVLLWKLEGRRVWLAMLLVYALGQGAVWCASHVLSEIVVTRSPLLHLPTFLLGILLSRWQSKHTASRTSTRFALLLATVAAGAAVLCVSPTLGYIALNDGLVAPLFGCVILLLSGKTMSGLAWLEASWLVLLGDASFGLYLLHIPILHLFMWSGLLKRAEEYPLYLLVCLAASVASFRWFEVPMRGWLLQLMNLRLSIRAAEGSREGLALPTKIA